MNEYAQSVSMSGRKAQDSAVKSERGSHTTHQGRSVTSTYGEILKRELLIGEREEGNYFKCY